MSWASWKNGFMLVNELLRLKMKHFENIYIVIQGAEAGFRKIVRTLAAPLDYIPLHIRGGYILPTQDPDVTTTAR